MTASKPTHAPLAFIIKQGKAEPLDCVWRYDHGAIDVGTRGKTKDGVVTLGDAPDRQAAFPRRSSSKRSSR